MPALNLSASCLFVLWLLSFTSGSDAAPTYTDHSCTDQTMLGVNTTYKGNTTFEDNLNILLSSLSSNATLHDGFYSTSVARGTPDVINGLFYCRFDTTPSVCRDCVTAAAKEIVRRCPNQTEAIIWYDVCMLRYSNMSYNNIIPSTYVAGKANVTSSDRDRFDSLLSGMLDSSTTKAENSQSEKFATGEEKFTSSQTLYSLVQCTPDVSSSDCNTCLRGAIGQLPICCDGRQGATVLLPACTIRYELYPFYNASTTMAPPLVPPHHPGTPVIIVFVCLSLRIWVLKRSSSYFMIKGYALRYVNNAN